MKCQHDIQSQKKYYNQILYRKSNKHTVYPFWLKIIFFKIKTKLTIYNSIIIN